VLRKKRRGLFESKYQGVHLKRVDREWLSLTGERAIQENGREGEGQGFQAILALYHCCSGYHKQQLRTNSSEGQNPGVL
jgi:hypothetical protein